MLFWNKRKLPLVSSCGAAAMVSVPVLASVSNEMFAPATIVSASLTPVDLIVL